MKTSTLLIVGGVAVAAYFLFLKKPAPATVQTIVQPKSTNMWDAITGIGTGIVSIWD